MISVNQLPLLAEVAPAVPRSCLRLVACLSMAAYFIANTPALPALGARAPAIRSLHGDASRALVARANSPSATRPCPHCAKPRCLAGKVVSPNVPVCSQSSFTGSCPCCPNSPPDLPCPCCPKGPDGRSCPCPGGCAFCTPAKVPCPGHSAERPRPGPCLGETVGETCPPYIPPFKGKLIRPPRA